MFRISTPFVIGLAILGVAWVLGGIVMICLSGSRVLAGLGSQRWPHVEGHIIQSDLTPVKDSSGQTAYYRVNVVYTYLPPGAVYACDNNRLSTRGFVDPADDSYSLAEAQRFTRRFPVGRAVTVYYRPGETVVSTLLPGTDLGALNGSIMGLVIALLGSLILRFMALVGGRSKLKAVTA